jgi:hypothetical protein
LIIVVWLILPNNGNFFQTKSFVWLRNIEFILSWKS